VSGFQATEPSLYRYFRLPGLQMQRLTISIKSQAVTLRNDSRITCCRRFWLRAHQLNGVVRKI